MRDLLQVCLKFPNFLQLRTSKRVKYNPASSSMWTCTSVALAAWGGQFRLHEIAEKSSKSMEILLSSRHQSMIDDEWDHHCHHALPSLSPSWGATICTCCWCTRCTTAAAGRVADTDESRLQSWTSAGGVAGLPAGNLWCQQVYVNPLCNWCNEVKKLINNDTGNCLLHLITNI